MMIKKRPERSSKITRLLNQTMRNTRSEMKTPRIDGEFRRLRRLLHRGRVFYLPGFVRYVYTSPTR